MISIDKSDRSFQIPADFTEPDIEWFDIKNAPFDIRGVLYDSEKACFMRMPHTAADRVSPGVSGGNHCTAGGRVRFATDSSYIAICVKAQYAGIMPHMPMTGQAGFDLYRMQDGRETYFSSFIPPQPWTDNHWSGTPTLASGHMTEYTINFPLYNAVGEVYIGLKCGASLKAPTPYRTDIPVVFYGNSITQGGCASRPGNSYQGFLSRRLSMDYINLGFSGSGRGEIEMAEYIAGLKMSALVMDYDSNAPSAASLRETYAPFIACIRNARPKLPIIMISHPAAIHGIFYKTRNYDTWGTFTERREVIEQVYHAAKSSGDQNVYYIDGRDIYRGEEWDACTVDGVHPNDLGFLRYAQCIEKILAQVLQ